MSERSPLEIMMAQTLRKQLSPHVVVKEEQTFSTRAGNYRVDFLLSATLQQVAIECDGREFHDLKADRLRDLALLTCPIDAIFRFRGCDIVFARNECMACLKRFAPFLFDAAAPSQSADDICFGSLSLLNQKTMPIYRGKLLLSEYESLPDSSRKLNTIRCVWRMRGSPYAIVELSSPNWTREWRGGTTCMRLGDYLLLNPEKAGEWLQAAGLVGTN